MEPTLNKTANNARYYIKCWNKNIGSIQEKDKWKEKFQRECAKWCNGEKHEEKRQKE